MTDALFYDLDEEDVEEVVETVPSVSHVTDKSLLSALLGNVSIVQQKQEGTPAETQISANKSEIEMPVKQEQEQVVVTEAEKGANNAEFLAQKSANNAEILAQKSVNNSENANKQGISDVPPKMETQDSVENLHEETTGEDGKLFSYETEGDNASGTYESTEISATHKTDGIEYPFLMLETDVLAQHKLIALRSMLVSYIKDNTVQMYHVYLKHSGSVLKVGITTAFSLRHILESKVFSEFSKYVKMDKNTRIEGDLMFALCGIPD